MNPLNLPAIDKQYNNNAGRRTAQSRRHAFPRKINQFSKAIARKDSGGDGKETI